jgi:hypothetical protein
MFTDYISKEWGKKYTKILLERLMELESNFKMSVFADDHNDGY